MTDEPQVGDNAVRGSTPEGDPSQPPDAANSDTQDATSTDVPDLTGDTADEGTEPPTNDEADTSTPDTSASDTPEVDPNADVSPTGNANVAGTPQSQLSQAPPMTDPSGSNVPAPNLRQPLAQGADPGAGAASTTSDGLDPALMDPEKAATDRVEGRTSDASTRSADGPHIDEVPPDITDGPKPSDGGPVAYPFPQGGDVDIATVSSDVQDGEYYPNLETEDSVILLEHDLVPDRLVGRRALVVDAPRYLVPMDEKDNVWITVRTRDEVNATLSVPLAAVEVRKGSLDVTVRG